MPLYRFPGAARRGRGSVLTESSHASAGAREKTPLAHAPTERGKKGKEGKRREGKRSGRPEGRDRRDRRAKRHSFPDAEKSRPTGGHGRRANRWRIGPKKKIDCAKPEREKGSAVKVHTQHVFSIIKPVEAPGKGPHPKQLQLRPGRNDLPEVQVGGEGLVDPHGVEDRRNH